MGLAYGEENKSFKYSKKKKVDQVLSLEKFMTRAGPVMEQILEENVKLRAMEGTQEKSKPIELKQTLVFPNEILLMLGDGNDSASVLKVTCVHTFETAP